MIQVESLTKTYGVRNAVDDLSFIVRPGQVTGFLGPNGAGKSTTMRCLVGLSRPTSGRALINGRSYCDLPGPLDQVGALFEATPVQNGRTAFHHVLAIAQTHGLSKSRVTEVLGRVGLESVSGHGAAGFSLGMRQRLGIAVALLGDPGVLIFDEPTNGLDPDGVLWLRTLLKQLAAEGRTVLVSSHLMSEMALTAHHLVIVGKGRLVADTSVDQLILTVAVDRVLVRSPHETRLRDLLVHNGATVTSDEPGTLYVSGLAVETISSLAASHQLTFSELTPQKASLEEAYMNLTRGSVEYGVRR
jgi:ABC-2 type transport system ATP-binding protein